MERSLMDSLRDPQNREEVSNQRSVIAGATPLLVGLLTGNTGDAVDIASKSLLSEDSRKLTEERTLMSYLEKRRTADRKAAATALSSTGAKKRYQSSAYEDDEGVTRLGTFDTFTGERELGDTKAGFSQKFIQDKRTGDYQVGSGATGKVRPTGQELDTVTPVFKKERDARYKAADTRLKPYRESLKVADEGLNLITTAGVMPKKMALSMVVKLAEGSRPTDEDRAFMLDAPSVLQGFQETAERETSGKLTPRQIEEATRIFTRIKKIQRKEMEKMVGQSVEAISETGEQKASAEKRFEDLVPHDITSEMQSSGELGDIEREMKKLEESGLL